MHSGESPYENAKKHLVSFGILTRLPQTNWQRLKLHTSRRTIVHGTTLEFCQSIKKTSRARYFCRPSNRTLTQAFLQHFVRVSTVQSPVPTNAVPSEMVRDTCSLSALETTCITVYLVFHERRIDCWTISHEQVWDTRRKSHRSLQFAQHGMAYS